MGYYDNHYGSEEPSRSHKRRGRGGWFWSGLLGAIIGVLVAAFILPALGLSYGSTANATPNQNHTAKVEDEAEPGTEKTINVDVNNAFTDAVDKVYDAVVGVINYQKAEFWGEAQPKGLGSGVIYKKENGKAYIVTNNHVVEGASKLEVSLSENTKVPAVLVGRDPLMDLAVIKINADKVKGVAEFGNSDDLERGEPVVAIGNPLGFAGTVTEGVVSAKDRTVPRDVNGDKQPDWRAEVIQTDAAINPGNSGGALINLAGQVIGINSLKIAQTAVEGIGFAIPINVAKPIIHEIEEYGKVIRPHIGIFYRPLSDFPTRYRKELFNLPEKVKTGLVIAQLEQGGPADRAGVQQGDVLVSINGNKIEDALKFRKYLYKKLEPGDKIKLGIYRNGKKITIPMQLGKSSST
ncbi:MAG TPA: trypsin-like peptidase domain-containing protein [Bacillales bacterium]|nr:trypsin-like peptidase domain-containing protein [Bacillales bacterium]